MKEKFIKSTIILIIGGVITKVFALFIRVITTREIGTIGIGLYMLIMPTYNLFINIATMSFTTAISKIVATDSYNNKTVVFNTIVTALLLNIIIILFVIIFSRYIAIYLLKNSSLYYPILVTSFTLPFITISSILRGYFFGKEKMFPHVFSNVVEQVIRIVLTIVLVPLFLKKGLTYTICMLVLFNIASEVSSTIIMILFLNKKSSIKKSDLKIRPLIIKDVLNIAFFTTIGRLTGSIGMFLEPIIITFVLINNGYDTNYITYLYGVISGYVLPVIAMPEFLSGAVSLSILPVISKLYNDKKNKLIKGKLIKAIYLSCSIGIVFTIIIILFPKLCLYLLFKTDIGAEYLRCAGLIFLLSYIIGPLSACMQAVNKSKKLMICQIISTSIKTIVLFIGLYFNLEMYALLISYLFYFIFIIFYQIKNLRSCLC